MGEIAKSSFATITLLERFAGLILEEEELF